MRTLARWSASPLLVLALLVVPSLARAGWMPGGVPVLYTTSHLAPVVACDDAAHGTFVVWQQAATPGVAGTLRAQHLLATGDVDPAWPAAGAPVSSATVVRSRIGTVSDGLGGCYVWWVEGSIVYVTRLGGDGAVAAGWTARGRSFGAMEPAAHAPEVIADGAHGIYATWVVDQLSGDDPYVVRLLHLGPDGLAGAGWTGSASRLVTPNTAVLTYETWPRLALVGDGGVYLAWASWSGDPLTESSAYRLLRLGADGTPASGWSAEGLAVRSFALVYGELDTATYPDAIDAAQIAIAPTGDGGVYVYSADPVALDSGGFTFLEPSAKVVRLLGDGSVSAAWPAGGVAPSWCSPAAYADAAFRAYPDGAGGVIIGSPALATDSPVGEYYQGITAAGAHTSAHTTGTTAFGHEVALDGAGGYFLGQFWPNGPSGPWSPPASLSVKYVDESVVPLYGEYHNDIMSTWYGDIAVASTGDGGAVYFWSQEREQFGLFARRFTAAGEVTGVESGAAPLAIALRGLRWSAGRGVSARVALTGGPATLELFDLAGRRLASERLGDDARGERDVTLAGTGRLGAGLYFARLTARDGERRGRVIVTP